MLKVKYLRIMFKKDNVTNRLALQLKQLIKPNARPLISAGNISLRRSQVTGPTQKKQKELSVSVSNMSFKEFRNRICPKNPISTSKFKPAKMTIVAELLQLY